MLRLVLAVLTLALAPGCGPGYPTNVRASVSGNTMTITWHAVSGAGHYDVCRKQEGYYGSSGDCSFLTPCTGSLQPKCVYTQEGSPSGKQTTFTYRARADDEQWGEWSNPVLH